MLVYLATNEMFGFRAEQLKGLFNAVKLQDAAALDAWTKTVSIYHSLLSAITLTAHSPD